MVDVANHEELVRYLLDKRVISEEEGYQVDYCSGGVSCLAAFITAGKREALVKQARTKLNVAVEWLADQSRIATESKANGVYFSYVPDCAPRVIFYDADNYILVREAAPRDCTMWKSDLLEGILDFGVAYKTIEALARIHNETFMDAAVAKEFADCNVFHQLRISPYIEYVMEQYPRLAQDIGEIRETLLSRKMALVHADYSPKNILVKDRKICILDFEIAHYGDPVFDLSFFLNHIALKSVKNKQWAAGYLNMLAYMADAYFSIIRYDCRANIEPYSVRLLGLLMLARIDGKSPVEYLCDDSDKALVRRVAAQLIRGEVLTLGDAAELLLKNNMEAQG
ncbi:MAG: aminoglycoside phosphotransferase family protein [Eubacteriales bacterium]|nr:aminoglycoside phosphotransferase family protein [Eubacteriales bacterium]